MAGLEHIVGGLADARSFVDFHAQSVTGAVKKALHAPVFPPGLVAFALKIGLHRLVNVGPARVGKRFSRKPISCPCATVSYNRRTASLARPRTTVRVMSPK